MLSILNCQLEIEISLTESCDNLIIYNSISFKKMIINRFKILYQINIKNITREYI